MTTPSVYEDPDVRAAVHAVAASNPNTCDHGYRFETSICPVDGCEAAPPAAKTAREIRDDLLELARRVNGLIPADMPAVEFRATSDGGLDVNPFGSDDVPTGERLADALGLTALPPKPTSAGTCFEWRGYVDRFPVEITIYSRSAFLHQGATCPCGEVHAAGVDTHGRPL